MSLLSTSLSRTPSARTASTSAGEHAPRRTGDFDCRARFAALREGDGENARLVRDGLPSGPFGGVERGASRALSSLLPKLSIADANPRHALNQRQRELVSDELVMR